MLIYSETRTERETRHLLETREIKVWRKIANTTSRDQLRSEKIRKHLKRNQIFNWIKAEREWDDHISRITKRKEKQISKNNKCERSH